MGKHSLQIDGCNFFLLNCLPKPANVLKNHSPLRKLSQESFSDKDLKICKKLGEAFCYFINNELNIFQVIEKPWMLNLIKT